MDHVERYKEMIRNDWFEDHVAEVRGEEGLQVISWGKPGTNMYRTKYVLSGNNVFISGDIGEAVYSLTCAATLDNIKGFNLGYFTGKLQAFCESRWNFDEKQAKKELREHWHEYEMNDMPDGPEIYTEIVEAMEESISTEAYQGWLTSVFSNTSMDSDTLEDVWDFGKVMPPRLIAYWVGLQMAAEQLAKEESA